jgi:hypothetical protein
LSRFSYRSDDVKSDAVLPVTTFRSFVGEFPQGGMKWALVRANLRRSLKLSDELTGAGEVFEYLGAIQFRC